MGFFLLKQFDSAGTYGVGIHVSWGDTWVRGGYVGEGWIRRGIHGGMDGSFSFSVFSTEIHLFFSLFFWFIFHYFSRDTWREGWVRRETWVEGGIDG